MMRLETIIGMATVRAARSPRGAWVPRCVVEYLRLSFRNVKVRFSLRTPGAHRRRVRGERNAPPGAHARYGMVLPTGALTQRRMRFDTAPGTIIHPAPRAPGAAARVASRGSTRNAGPAAMSGTWAGLAKSVRELLRQDLCQVV